MESKEIKDRNQTEIVVLLDRSGSMASIGQATVEGFNTFLNEQKNAEGEAFMTLVQFDDRYEMNYQSLPVKDATPLILGENFIPRGSTALIDAIGKTIDELNTDRDVVFVIITDGEENASVTYKREAIMKMIETQTEAGWKFLFLAANQDAIKAGGTIGIKGANSINYSSTADSTINVFANVSQNMSKYRNAKFNNLDLDLKSLEGELDFTDEQRDKSK
jgi:Mg-chelatase subunit ChlD